MGDEARILVVCTGNICRSPFIERLLQHRLDERRPGSGRSIHVTSAGTGAVTGYAMDERAAAQLVAHGGDPSGFRARDITPALIAESDLVLTATREHRGKVALMYPKALRRVFTFCDFADLLDGVDRPNGVDDPNRVEGPKGVEVLNGVDGPNGVGGPYWAVTRPDSGAWVRRVTEQAAASRGLKPPLELARADIVDPYRRADEVFVTMAQQIIGSMPSVVRALAG